MVADPWLSGESTLGAVVHRYALRALGRPIRVLSVALFMTSAYVAARSIKAPIYRATLFFRLAEGDLGDATESPRPPRAIREYISSVVLSRARTEDILKKHNWSTGRLARNPVAAIDEFREELKIEVDRNDFLVERRPGDLPRSAHVKISLSGSNAEQTRALLHAIGQAVLQTQAVQRSGHLERARELVRAQISLSRAQMQELQDRTARMWLDAARADAESSLAIRAQTAPLEAGILSRIEKILALEQRDAAMRIAASVEGSRMGLNFILFDETVETLAPRLTAFQMACRAAIVCGIVLVLTVVVASALNDRVYVPEDLTARGVPILGALPRFPGDDAGSYRARMPSARASQ